MENNTIIDHTTDSLFDKRNFENNQITITDLPRVEDIQYTPLNRQLLYANLTSIGIVGGIAIFIVCIAVILNETIASFFFYIMPILLFLIIVVAWIEWKGFPLRGYALRQHDIFIRSGLWWRSVSIIPFNRVQHIHFQQGPIDRLFELAEIHIHTAGEHSIHDVNGLTPHDAIRIKEYIMQYVRQSNIKTEETVHTYE